MNETAQGVTGRFVIRWVLLSALGLGSGLVLGLGLAGPIEALVGMVLVTPLMLALAGSVFGASQWLAIWKWLFFTPGRLVPERSRSAQWNRGRYLADALVHCAECHTPRNMLGALKTKYWMAGTDDGPEGTAPPNITPDRETGIGKWSEDDMVEALSSGMLPDGDEFGELMADVVEHGTAKLTDGDRRAIAVYIRSLKPIPNGIGKK